MCLNTKQETQAMKTLHQELTSTNLELKAIVQKVIQISNDLMIIDPHLNLVKFICFILLSFLKI